ncbi:MAG TPA: TetR family transcriptional regulator [Acidimicrobiales bacterium]
MSPPRRTPETAEALRASLVDHARRLVAREGADALTMRRLAGEAGCALGLPYKVFADRRDLVIALLRAELASIRDDALALAARAGTGTVGGNLAWFALRLLDSPAVALAREVIDDPTLAHAVTADAHGEVAGPTAFDVWFAEYLAAEQRAGRVQADVDVGAIGYLIAGAVHNLIVTGATHPRPGRERLAAVLAAVADRL